MKLTERDKAVIWHPYTQMKTAPVPIAVKKASGAVFWDENDKPYIDMISSWWVNIHGHSHPFIAQKVYEQFLELEHIIFAGVTHEPAVKLAEKLVAMTELSAGKVFYSDNGSTAVEVALKMAIQFHLNKGEKRKTKIVAFEGAYHGDTFGAMSVSTRGAFTLAFQNYLFDVEFLPFPEKGREEESIQKMQDLTAKGDVAAFIFEPLVLGAGGMKMYHADVLEKLMQICINTEVITIADEVMTGFGRTGKMLATNYVVSKPDIICLSKGITGGVMPLGATVASGKIYDTFYDTDKMKALYHGHSFTANPLSCAAALASFELFEKQQLTDYQLDILITYSVIAERLKEYPVVKNIRNCGTILAFDVNTSEDSYFSDIRETIYTHYLKDGLFVRPLGNVIYFMPPYIISSNELETAAISTYKLLEKLSTGHAS